MWTGKARIVSLARQYSQLRSSCQLLGQQQRSYMQRAGGGAARDVTVIPGDGIGPLVTGDLVRFQLEAKDVPVHFETNEGSGKMVTVPEEDFECVPGSVRK